MDNKFVTLTSLVKKLTDATAKGVVRTSVNEIEISLTCTATFSSRMEWNVNPPTLKSNHQSEKTLKETGTWVSQIGKYP
ncbi:hypothetical protein TNCV_3494421 [Trichonephila clavipes]|nr:hypothetical protein TNCV_3494421 [Trichonephila clavipes]